MTHITLNTINTKSAAYSRNQFLTSNKEAKRDARSVPLVHEHIESDGSCINRTKVVSANTKPTVRKCFVCCQPLDVTPKQKRVTKLKSTSLACIDRTKMSSDKLPPCKSAPTPLYIPRTKKTLVIKRPQDDAKNRKVLPNEEFTATNEVFRILK